MLKDIISLIEPLNLDAMSDCQAYLDSLTKPVRSLNGFEKLACKIAGVTGNPRPNNIKKSLVIMQSNWAEEHHKKPALKILARHAKSELDIVNLQGNDLMKAIQQGIKIAQEQIVKGIQVIGLADVKLIGGLDTKEKNPFRLLKETDSIEIAAMVGLILGAASGKLAIVLDGLASSFAALIAVKIAPLVKPYLIASHYSVEPEHKEVIDMLGITAYLHLDMRCVGGLGAVLGMSLVDASLHVVNDMKTFEEAGVAEAHMN